VHKIDFHRRHVYARLTGHSRRRAVLNLRSGMKFRSFRFFEVLHIWLKLQLEYIAGLRSEVLTPETTRTAKNQVWMGCCGLENSEEVTVTYVHLREYETTIVTWPITRESFSWVEQEENRDWQVIFVIVFTSFRISLQWINWITHLLKELEMWLSYAWLQVYCLCLSQFLGYKFYMEISNFNFRITQSLIKYDLCKWSFPLQTILWSRKILFWHMRFNVR
jgi:hypothetical protein